MSSKPLLFSLSSLLIVICEEIGEIKGKKKQHGSFDYNTISTIKKISTWQIQRHRKNHQWWLEWTTLAAKGNWDTVTFLQRVWHTLVIVNNLSWCRWIHFVEIFFIILCVIIGTSMCFYYFIIIIILFSILSPFFTS